MGRHKKIIQNTETEQKKTPSQAVSADNLTVIAPKKKNTTGLVSGDKKHVFSAEDGAKGRTTQARNRELQKFFKNAAELFLLPKEALVINDDDPVGLIIVKTLLIQGCGKQAVEVADKFGLIEFTKTEMAKSLAKDIEVAEVKPTIHTISSYIDFSFYAKKPLIFVYGTTRSGKTFTIVQWMLTKLNEGLLKGQSLIAGMTIPFLTNGAVAYIRQLVVDFPNLTIKNNGREVINIKTGDLIVSQSFEKPERALGGQWNLVFFNECNTLSVDIVDALRMRTEGLTIADFNPSRADWWGKDLLKDDNTLFCSFKDNPFLSETQKSNIEDIRVRGEFAPVGSYDHWYYQVYYLGNFSTLGGGVFTNVIDATSEEFPSGGSLLEVFGIDFGDTTDPNALVRVVWDSGKNIVHVKTELYETKVSDKDICDKLISLNVERLVFETATGGNTRALNWRDWGLSRDVKIYPCEKTSVQQGVFSLAKNQIKCYDKYSVREFAGYTLNDGKFSGADHCIDATRYAYHLLETNKIR